MSLATRFMLIAIFFFAIVTHVVSCQNLTVINQFLTNLQDNLCIQGYLIKVSPQGVACIQQPDVMLIAVSFLLLLPMLCLTQISPLQINF